MKEICVLRFPNRDQIRDRLIFVNEPDQIKSLFHNLKRKKIAVITYNLSLNIIQGEVLVSLMKIALLTKIVVGFV